MKKRYIVLIIILIFFIKWEYNKYTLNQDKNNILVELENYKKTNQKFPSDLSNLHIDISTKFYYKTDTLNQSFRLSYLSGFMDLNCCYFDSKKGIWKYEYTE